MYDFWNEAYSDCGIRVWRMMELGRPVGGTYSGLDKSRFLARYRLGRGVSKATSIVLADYTNCTGLGWVTDFTWGSTKPMSAVVIECRYRQQ